LDESKITGATLRGTAGTDNTFMGLALGSKRSTGWFHFKLGGQSSDPNSTSVLVESPIDAMSFAVLDRTESRKTIYLSTDGAGTVPLEFLQQLPNKSVAYDNDQSGNLMAQSVMEQLPNRYAERQVKDWNEEQKICLIYRSSAHSNKKTKLGIESRVRVSFCMGYSNYFFLSMLGELTQKRL